MHLNERFDDIEYRICNFLEFGNISTDFVKS